MYLFDTHYDLEQGLALARRVDPNYRPVFEKLAERDRAMNMNADIVIPKET